MAYTEIDKPSDYFETKLYTGNGSTQSITGVGFQPDLLWIRNRLNSSRTARAIDSVRGVGKLLNIAGSADEDTQADTVTSFDSDGFSLGADSSEYGVNDNTGSHVAWSWKAGTNGSGTTTGSGTGKAYSYSVSTASGFSIVKYLGNGSAGHTIPHHLGSSVPKMIIVKELSNADDWNVYHASLGNTKEIYLNVNNAASSSDAPWNNTTPTSSVFTVSADGGVNTNDASYIAYCFAEKQGYSKFGSYVGNGSTNGSYIHLGFKPAFVMVKRTDSTANWQILDNKRNTYNPWNTALFPDTSDPDTTDYSTDHLSNGFKLRVTTTSRNGSGASYIYMAFAENPFVTSTGVPACAR